MAQSKKYDAFLAYSTEDGEEIANKITQELETLGMKCHTNVDFEFGEPLVESIADAMTNSDKIILLVTKMFLKAKWTQFEVQQAINEMYRRRETALIPILCGVSAEQLPKDLKDIKAATVDPKTNDSKFFKDLAEMIKGDPIKLGGKITVPNVGYGLAWSYFYGYLKMVLPGMVERIDQSEFCKEKKFPFFKKFIIVLAETGYCPHSLSKVDPNMKMAGRITFKANRAGQMQRDYSSTVWEVTDPGTKETHYVVIEFATPLMSLYEMTDGQIAGLSAESKSYQIKLFQSTMNQIINHPNSGCQDTVVFMTYDGSCKDANSEEDSTFAKKVIDFVKSQNVTTEDMDTS